MSSPSDRAQRWSRHDPFLVKAHFACARDPFEPGTNPRGYVNFGTAENHLLFDRLEPLLRESAEIHEKDTHYNELHGAGFFREAIAALLSRRAGRELAAENLVIASGASAILEILSFVLCDPGDALLIPTPYYSGFDHDLALRSGARLVPILLPGPDFQLTLADIEKAYATASGPIRGILLNSPQNPLGHVFDEDLIRDTVAFARMNGLHVILDEIYAEALLPGVSHFSGLSLRSPQVHVVYGFAKDFGLSGYKVGVLHSENREIIAAARGVSYFHAVAMPAQRMLANLLHNPQLERFLETMRARLAESHGRTSSALSTHGIGLVPPRGGIVMWLDLRRLLPEASFAGERRLFETIFSECRVNISPGQAFHCSEPGWFRLCYTIGERHREEGLSRLTAFLR
jgi:aspartate/methionine/tyrosine aminotransferase